MKNCEINVSLEDILPKLNPVLQRKLQHSVDLLRKAEVLALSYAPEEGYTLGVSGGKDSQCLYHVTKLANVKFTPKMSLTSVDPPEVVRFMKQEYPDVVLLKPKDSIYNLAVRHRMLPTKKVRWCCADYKEGVGAGSVTLTGVRKEESTRRAKRNEVEVSRHQYTGDLEGLDEFREQRNKRKSKFAVSIVNTHGERTLGCIHGKETLILNPILEWTEKEVWEFLNAIGVKHCVLYDEGFHRIGCIQCPMGSLKTKKIQEARWPHVKRSWIKAIKKLRAMGYYGDDMFNHDAITPPGTRFQILNAA